MIPVDDTGHETDLETIVIVTTTIFLFSGLIIRSTTLSVMSQKRVVLTFHNLKVYDWIYPGEP